MVVCNLKIIKVHKVHNGIYQVQTCFKFVWGYLKIIFYIF